MITTPSQFALVVHATHEAGVKVGGIGAVLDGLLGARAYNAQIPRTILVGPMSTRDPVEMARLIAPRNQLEISYSSHHDVRQAPEPLSAQFQAIEAAYRVKILVGLRRFGSARHQVILVDAADAEPASTHAFQYQLYEHFGLQSDRYQDQPEFSQHIQAAEPAWHALQAVAQGIEGPRCIVAHEFMGLPLCYSARLHDPAAYCTVFYGHEVATVRRLVESHPGHDTMFYNVLKRATADGLYLEDVFGDQSAFYKHALIRPAASTCDNILAVGDRVVEEMRFLGPDWAQAHIDLVYNGVPSYPVGLGDYQESKARLQQYSLHLLGYQPDHVFTHVTRFVPSKGLWRDISVMERLDPLLHEQGQTAVLLVLSTVIPVGRPARAIHSMEESYGWPVRHIEGDVQVDGADVPDLIGHEVPFYEAIETFNRTAQASQIVLVNQFGWNREQCGLRMPADMSFGDIRRGTDVEFGQSIYEPFGIAQLEPLSSGALCVMSNVCGCVGFVERSGGLALPNVIVADYTNVHPLLGGQNAGSPDIAELQRLGQSQRDQIEAAQASDVARLIADRLASTDMARQTMIRDGYELSQAMSWEVVARDYFVPALRRALAAPKIDHRAPK